MQMMMIPNNPRKSEALEFFPLLIVLDLSLNSHDILKLPEYIYIYISIKLQGLSMSATLNLIWINLANEINCYTLMVAYCNKRNQIDAVFIVT